MERISEDGSKGRTDNNRKRLLLLLTYLYKHTDGQEGHQASVADLIRVCEEAGINGNRNTIRDDIIALLEAGFDIRSIQGNNKARLYYYGERLFDVKELNLLVDAVSASDSISGRRKKQLVRKIAELCSEFTAEELQHSLHADTTADVETNGPISDSD